MAFIETLPHRDKLQSELVPPELEHVVRDLPLCDALRVAHEFGGRVAELKPDAVRWRRDIAHEGDTPSRSGKPKHRPPAVSWDVGLPVVRKYLADGEKLKDALRLADLDLGLVGNSEDQPIRAMDDGAPDHSRALDNWYRRALKAEAKVQGKYS